MDYVLLRKIFRDCFRLDTIEYEKTKVLTVAHDTDRSHVHNGKYYSPLIDTMEDDLALKGERCISVARVISAIKGETSYGRVRSPEGRFARALVTKRLKAAIWKNAYPFSGMEESAWGRILDVTRARKVIGIQPSRELCVACHKRGIWVADVQHGAIAGSHLWYGEKFRGHEPLEYLPDSFLCWDQGSAEVIRSWADRRGVATQVTGNRWLARFMQRAPGDVLVRDLFDRFERDSRTEDPRKTILVALSWGETSIPNGFIIDGLERVIRETAHQYRWLIRLHPNQIKGFATDESERFWKYFNETLAGSAEWEIATRYPLPLILRNIDLHISWTSSVCIEASQMGVRSALLSPVLRSAGSSGDYYEYYRNRGMIDFVPETPESIRSWIEENIGRKSGPEDYGQFDAEYRNVIDFLAA